MTPASLADLLNDELRELAPALPARVWERVLLGPARDVLSRPSKQFRANLVEIAWRLGGGTGAPPPALAAAIEILHAGSLVIDDIEDDAELRRGAPALHRSHGLPIALNTGNWMYFFAFAIIERAAVADGSRIDLHRAMLRGVLDCHRGQALDLGHDVTQLARADLRAVVQCTTTLKAGALTRLAAELGAIAAGADRERRAAICAFGEALGNGLQMLDDLSTVTVAARVDKSREDLWQLRPTWAWVWMAEVADEATWMRGLRWAQQVARRREDPQPLARLLGSFAARRGLVEAHDQLVAARGAVEQLAEPATLAFLDGELARLEASHV